MGKPVVLFFELKIANKDRTICDLCEKLFDNDISVTIFAGNSNTATNIDNLLWTWKQESFLPHSIHKDNNTTDKIVINHSKDIITPTQAIILYDPLPLDKLEKYKLIIDFAEKYHSEKIIESRKRYKEIRDSGKFNLFFTQIGAFLSKESISLEKMS